MGTVHQFPTEAERQAMKPLPVLQVVIDRPRDMRPQTWGFGSDAEMAAALSPTTYRSPFDGDAA